VFWPGLGMESAGVWSVPRVRDRGGYGSSEEEWRPGGGAR
jgi:hypothetical protein